MLTTNINAELRAISYGLQIIWDHGFRDIICELDSQTTLTLIKDGVLLTHSYHKSCAPLIDKIYSYMLREIKMLVLVISCVNGTLVHISSLK